MAPGMPGAILHGSSSTGEPGEECICPVPGSPGLSLALLTSCRMRRIGDGPPRTMMCHHLTGCTERTTRAMRYHSCITGTSLPSLSSPARSSVLLDSHGSKKSPGTTAHPSAIVAHAGDAADSFGPSSRRQQTTAVLPAAPKVGAAAALAAAQDPCVMCAASSVCMGRVGALCIKCRCVSTGCHPSSKPSQSCSAESQLGLREQLAAPQSLAACKNSLQSEQQVDEGRLVASSEVLERPGHAEKSPEKSPGTDPQAAEQEPAAGSKPVEPEGGEEAAGSQQLCALELEPVSSETTSTSEEEGWELIPLEVTVEPSSTQPSEAGSSVCTEAAAAARTGQPPWAWTELAAGFQSVPRPPRSAHSPSSTDPRSAAILTKKESIEQGYHDFCLNFATVSTMLLQKEPSMEAMLMKALRANLRELRNHLLKEMEDFIQQYDATHPSC
ncbi:uncharacterized protein LOC116236960 isoform X4 [Phasianus colchicus]|uniref:uncharacterized protein LOC116236960 isoform X4 n=1 Tax=Phasianus colchicus TaxID=9054 RepID=UPI00129E1D3A|nr:uncharacterized protein LOC116236960 isoform X4 [Phasianus colchicus]